MGNYFSKKTREETRKIRENTREESPKTIDLIRKLNITRKVDKVKLLYDEAKKTGTLLEGKSSNTTILVPYEIEADKSSMKAFIYTKNGNFYPELQIKNERFEYNLIVLYLVKIDDDFCVRHVGTHTEYLTDINFFNKRINTEKWMSDAKFQFKDSPPVYKEKEDVGKPPPYETASAPEK